MRNLLILAFLCYCLTVSGTTYYVSSSGNDVADGKSTSTSWATLNKVNGFSFVAGDNILFNRGDTFYGTLKISSSGTSASRITFGAYGTGANPVITGFTTISGWTNYGNGIYSKIVAPETDVNVVTVDGVNTAMGRYPKQDNWLTYESCGTNNIVDNQLSGSPNWTGADVVIKKTGYLLDRLLISNHTGNTVTYNPTAYNSKGDATGMAGGDGQAGWGYFFEHSLTTLSTINGTTPTLGEWFHNGTTFYMYFGSVDPNTKVVKVGTLTNGVTSTQSYVTVDHINFQGFNGTGINVDGANNMLFTNCEVGFAGVHAAYPGTKNTFDYCYFHDTNGVGLYGGVGWTFTNSTLENIAVFDGGWYGWDGMGIGAQTSNGGVLFQYNIVRNTGMDGLFLSGSNVTIDRNLFDNCCSRSFDQAAIYMTGNNTNRVISNNIIINTAGSMSGVPGSWTIWTTTEGIYLDEPSSGVIVSGNTVAKSVHGSGIKLHEAHDVTISNNTVYNNEEGYQFLGSGAQPSDPIRNISMSGNKIIAASAGQILWVFWSINDEIPLFGTANGQYYARLVDDGVNQDFYTREVSAGEGFRTYSYWLSRSGETSSNFSSITVSDANKLRFEYNATKSNKTVTLDAGYNDVTGTKYSGSITLLPYTSLVLMLDPNPTVAPAIPVYVSSAIENSTPSILAMTYNMTLANIVPSPSAFSVIVNSIARTVTAVSLSGTTVQLTLTSPVVYGDVVTVSYNKPSSNPLQTTAGGQAASISVQATTNKVNSVLSPVYVSSVVQNSTPLLLEMTYNLTLANIVPAATSFSVMVNSAARTVNAVAISGVKIQLTLSGRVLPGDIITVSYTKPATNPIQTAQGVTAVNISNQQVINNCINTVPTAVITSPVANSSFTASANITITANASDADGSVSLVEFYNGSTKLGSKSSAPYSLVWNNVTAGKYSLTAVATDNLNAKTTSSAILISVISSTSKVNQHPKVKISSPRKGLTFDNQSAVTIEAEASDPDGTISKVELFNGKARLVELTDAPYSFTWKNVTVGTYSITAIATDNLNDTTVSAPVEFIVGTTAKYDANSDIIKLYPNPNNGHFSIQFINPLQNDKSEIIITDLSGKQVYNSTVLKEEMTKQIDVSDSRKGMYIMMIKDKEILVTKKFIKN